MDNPRRFGALVQVSEPQHPHGLSSDRHRARVDYQGFRAGKIETDADCPSTISTPCSATWPFTSGPGRCVGPAGEQSRSRSTHGTCGRSQPHWDSDHSAPAEVISGTTNV